MFIIIYKCIMFSLPIEFRFNIELEVERVKETLGILNWLIKNNYKFSLPKGIKETNDFKIEIIRQLVEKEYNLEIYQVAKEAILKSWQGNSGKIRKINQKMDGSNILDKLDIFLTRYGTRGSYKGPNSIVINVSSMLPEFLIKVVIHESFHLMIEPLVKKYEVEHWVKERIMDLIMDFEYKARFKAQSVPEWVLAVDAVFKEVYPDMNLLMQKASAIHL